MPYLEISFSPLHNDNDKSILTAELLAAGFDSFNEEEDRILAYIETGLFTHRTLEEITFLRIHPGIKVDIKPLEDINWNREWESNYQPVTIAGKCHVRAPFHHVPPGMAYDIIIEPKMAFGTAHHETTQLMAAWLMELDVKGKSVLDLGCGTGILAILADKMGAEFVTGIDNDEWAWRNALDNFRINGVTAGEVRFGDSALVGTDRYDVILANINRNVLLQDMKACSAGIREGGVMLLSGFYERDIETIAGSAAGQGLDLVGPRTLNDWAALKFIKRNR
jgi:ribosomal protein L11 methyltransferase